MSGHSATTLLLGNPVRGSGYFYETHSKPELGWKRFHVSSLTSPRVSADYVREMAEKYGEESNAYRIRVLGEFPQADDDTIIPLELVQSAVNRDISPGPSEPMIWGLDVARMGSDSSVLVKRRGNVLSTSPRIWKNLDLMQLCGAVINEYDSADLSLKPQEILVDSIGLGAGVVDRLRELQLPVRGINVSESPALGEKVTNLRSELWQHAKHWFEKRTCTIPADQRLIDELTMVRYSFTSAGKLQIGLWCSLCSPIAAEIVSDSGFDWLLLDTEHSPNDLESLLTQAQAAARQAVAEVRLDFAGFPQIRALREEVGRLRAQLGTHVRQRHALGHR